MFHGMPCLESKNNGLFYVLPQVSYSPPASYIPVALASKVLTVNKHSASHGFTGGGILQPGLAPARSSAGSPATWPDRSQAALPAFLHPSPPVQLNQISSLNWKWCIYVAEFQAILEICDLWCSTVGCACIGGIGSPAFFFLTCYLFQLWESKLLSKIGIFSCSPQVML